MNGAGCASAKWQSSVAIIAGMDIAVPSGQMNSLRIILTGSLARRPNRGIWDVPRA